MQETQPLGGLVQRCFQRGSGHHGEEQQQKQQQQRGGCGGWKQQLRLAAGVWSLVRNKPVCTGDDLPQQDEAVHMSDQELEPSCCNLRALLRGTGTRHELVGSEHKRPGRGTRQASGLAGDAIGMETPLRS